MLPRNNRLALKNQWQRMRKRGKLINAPFFNLLFIQEKNSREPAQFAFVVSNKIDKRASARHRIKRLLAESLRPLLSKIKTGTKGVFLVKKEIVEKGLEEIKIEVERLIKSADVFRNKLLNG